MSPTSIDQLPFVGRDSEGSALRGFLDRVDRSDGGTLVVEGPAGIGKSTLLRESLNAAVQTRPDLLLATCTCDSSSSMLSPTTPFAELLASMQSGRRSKLSDMARRTVRETAPDWLAAIPMVGPLASAGAKTVRAAIAKPAVGNQAIDAVDALIGQYARTLQALIDRGAALLLVIEDAQWLARPGYQLLAAVGEATAGRAGLVVTYDRRQVEADRPIEEELSRIQVRHGGERIDLKPLRTDDLAAALQFRFGSELHGLFPAWLAQFCGGNPLLVEHYLDFLRRRGEISQDPAPLLSPRLVSVMEMWSQGYQPSEAELPPALQEMLRLRLQQLSEEDLELLRAAATQGFRFSADLLSLVTGHFADRSLRRLERRTGLVTRMEGDDPFFPESDVYQFENGIAHQAIYDEMGHNESRKRHLSVAEGLAGLTATNSAELHELLAQIGLHRLAAGDARGAATDFLRAGEIAYSNGHLIDAIELSGRAYVHGRADSTLLPKAGLVLLQSTEPWWGAQENEAENVWSLLDTTLDSAAECGDQSLLAQVQLVTARYFRERGEQRSARVLMRHAASISEAADSDTVRLAALIDLGYATSPVNLAEGLGILHAAERLHWERFGRSRSPEHLRQSCLLQAYIGVGEFDAGRFGEAGSRLAAAVTLMEELKMRADLPRALSFVGQLQLATGAFAEAEATFRRGMGLLSARGPGAGLSAYNRTLLGKLWLERGDLAKARSELDEARASIARLPRVDFELSLRLYQAELLIGERTLAEAQQECQWVVSAAGEADYPGVSASAKSLLGKAYLETGELDRAARTSTAAVEALAGHDGLVLARVEEILFRHVRILRAAHTDAPIEPHVRRAHEVVSSKAHSIVDPDVATHFLSLPLNVEIGREAQALALGDPLMAADQQCGSMTRSSC